MLLLLDCFCCLLFVVVILFLRFAFCIFLFCFVTFVFDESPFKIFAILVLLLLLSSSFLLLFYSYHDLYISIDVVSVWVGGNLVTLVCDFDTSVLFASHGIKNDVRLVRFNRSDLNKEIKINKYKFIAFHFFILCNDVIITRTQGNEKVKHVIQQQTGHAAEDKLF